MAIPLSSIHYSLSTNSLANISFLSSQATPIIDKGKGIATELDEDPSKRLVHASTIIRPNPDELDKEEKIKKATEEAKLLAMSRPKVNKVVQEEAKKIGLYPRKIASAKVGMKFKKTKDVGFEVSRESTIKRSNHTKKKELRFHKNSDILCKRYERLKKIPKELGIQSALPAPVPEQASSQTSGRKRKHMELEPEVKVPRLDCNRSLHEGVPFVNHMVIEEPEYGIFFIDVFVD
ncbi:hypothetical protein Tco_0636909 [Tanacetum coccineum]